MTGPVVSPLLPGDPAQVGRYRLIGRIGQGGMGVVFLAQAEDGRRVALKMVHQHLAGDPKFRLRFRNEVARARRVPPFCTAEVLDADPDHEPPYLVAEYVDGPSLADVVREQGPFTPANLHALAIGVAAALTAIHDAGVVHRDLKPSNVLLAPGSPKVIDFGIARTIDPTTMLTASEPGQVIGTVPYMAPERLASGGADAPTPAVDIFAWGAVVAFAGTGRTPFDADSLAAVAARILSHPPELDGLAPALRPLVEEALAKDPAQRPTAHQLLQRLLGVNVGAGEQAARGGDTKVVTHAVTRRLEDAYTAPGGADGDVRTAPAPDRPAASPAAGGGGVALWVDGSPAAAMRTAHLTVTARNDTGRPVELTLGVTGDDGVTAGIAPPRLTLPPGAAGNAVVTVTGQGVPPLRPRTHRLTVHAVQGDGSRQLAAAEFRHRIPPLTAIAPIAVLLLLVLVLGRLAWPGSSTDPGPTGPFTLAIGDTVAPGAPDPGAGRIEKGETRDLYLFEGKAKQRIYLQALDKRNGLRWVLLDPDGRAVFEETDMSPDGDPRDPLTLPATGTYQLFVYANGTTGTYRFTLWPADDSLFRIKIGDQVADGTPAPGAGNIETPGSRDVYEFTGTKDQRIYLDVEGKDGPNLDWVLWGPDTEKPVFDGTDMYSGGDEKDQGPLTLPETGTYRLTVYGNGDATGTYQFTLRPAEDSHFRIKIGDQVADGTPAPGAGNIETPAARDIYEFAGRKGQTIHLDVEGDNGPNLGWVLWGRGDTPVMAGSDMYPYGSPSDKGPITLPETGIYRLIVYGNGDATGTYRFLLKAG